MSQSTQRINYRRNPNPPPHEVQNDIVFASENCIRGANKEIKKLERLIESLKLGPPKYPPTLGHDEYFPLFPQFSRFPFELRIKIWKLALPVARMIEITTKGDYECLVKKCPDITFCDREVMGAFVDREPLKSRTALFLVCHESHSVAVGVFAYCLGTTPIVPPDDVKDVEFWLLQHEPACEVATKGIRFQPACDTIYLPESLRQYDETLLMANIVSKLDTSNVTSVAIEEGWLLDTQEGWKCLFKGYEGRPALFTAVKEVIILRWPGSDFDIEPLLQKFRDLPNTAEIRVEVLKTDFKLFREGYDRWNMPSETTWDTANEYRRSVELHKDLEYLMMDG